MLDDENYNDELDDENDDAGDDDPDSVLSDGDIVTIIRIALC